MRNWSDLNKPMIWAMAGIPVMGLILVMLAVQHERNDLGLLWGFLTVLATYSIFVAHTRERHFRGALLFPAGLILMMTTALPMLYMFYISFFDVEMISFNSKWNFIGLKNYFDLLFKDAMLWTVFWRTFEFLLLSVGLQLVLGMILALMVNREFPGKKLLQVVLLFPVLTTPVVVSMIWKYMFDFNTGLINQLLQMVHLTPQPWLSFDGLPIIKAIPGIGSWMVTNLNCTYAFFVLILVTVWQWAPFCYLIFYSGLASLPQEPFEAAKVDGASPWQTFRYLTFPLLRPLIVVVLLIRVIDLLKLFAPVWVMFGNALNIRLLNDHLYTMGLITHEYSKTSALGIIAILIVLGFSMLMSRWLKEEGA